MGKAANGKSSSRQDGRKRKKRRWVDRILVGAFLVSLVFLSFLGGAFVTEFEITPYPELLEPPLRGLRARWEKSNLDWSESTWGTAPEDPTASLRQQAPTAQTGVSVYDRERAWPGLTLYSSPGDPSSAVLISMDGEVVHRWHLPFREAWPDPPHVEDPVPERQIFWRRTWMLPEGDLLAVYRSAGDTPGGYGLARIDKDSRLVWKFSDHVHHDVHVGPDDRIYTLTHEIRRQAIPGYPHLSTPMLEDFVVALSPEGEEIGRWSVYDAFANSEFREFFASTEDDPKGDHLHTNTVHVVPDAFAERHAFCSPGDLVVSMRNNSTIAILRPGTGRMVWAAQGIWKRQHDPDPLPNGHLLLFDNLGRRGGEGRSRLIELDPGSMRIHWVHTGGEQQAFESHFQGSQQLLPNDHVLVTESTSGRIFEVTRGGEIVWQYHNPIRSGANDELVALVCGARRYAYDEVRFLKPEQMKAAQEAGRRD